MNKIKKCLIVTFDFSQRGKSATSYAAGCLLSACKQHKGYGKIFEVEHLFIEMNQNKEQNLPVEEIANKINMHYKLEVLSGIALGCYVWNTEIIEPLIQQIKDKGFKGNIILGGYQIHELTCKSLYPNGDIYLPNYAEVSLPNAFMQDKLANKLILTDKVDFNLLQSPYLDGSILLEKDQAMIHWETRRGCYYKCTFCAHRDLKNNEVYSFPLERIKQELKFFKNKNVKKINILDPIFRSEDRSYKILEYAIELELKSKLVFQVRFENISDRLLELFCQLNIHLEFGLQTAIKAESEKINRRNNMNKISSIIDQLQNKNISFEVSLIYGLPTQTFESFSKSITFLQEKGITEIKAFPLMILEGTKLFEDKKLFGIKEDYIDESRILHVIESDSFTNKEWRKMQALADLLKN